MKLEETHTDTHMYTQYFLWGEKSVKLDSVQPYYPNFCMTSHIQPDSVVKNPSASVGDEGLISGSGRSPGGGHGNPLQYSCLKNPMDRGAWRAIVHRVANS